MKKKLTPCATYFESKYQIHCRLHNESNERCLKYRKLYCIV